VRRLSNLLLPWAFGVLMLGAAAHRAHGAELWLPAAGVVALVLGARVRAAATAAVLIAVTLVVIADPTPMFTALAGLAAAAYLVTREGRAAVTTPTVFGAVAFTAGATIAVAVPVDVAWLPLAAPLVLLAAYLVAVRPFLAEPR
jgi:hypothetical protein